MAGSTNNFTDHCNRLGWPEPICQDLPYSVSDWLAGMQQYVLYATLQVLLY